MIFDGDFSRLRFLDLGGTFQRSWSVKLSIEPFYFLFSLTLSKIKGTYFSSSRQLFKLNPYPLTKNQPNHTPLPQSVKPSLSSGLFLLNQDHDNTLQVQPPHFLIKYQVITPLNKITFNRNHSPFPLLKKYSITPIKYISKKVKSL